MNDVYQASRDRYRGASGEHYFAAQFAHDAATRAVVARERARKFQPFIEAGDDVLEYGVGTGLNLAGIQCRRRVGYDVSDAGRDEVTAAGIEFVTDLSDLRGQSFSVVICHHALEHVPDPLAVLREIHAVLRPGGRLVLCVPFETHRAYRRWVPNEPNHHLYSWNAITLGNLATEAGFEVVDSHVSPYGYEQALARFARHGDSVYRMGLRLIRWLRPADEVMLIGRKPVIRGGE